MSCVRVPGERLPPRTDSRRRRGPAHSNDCSIERMFPLYTLTPTDARTGRTRVRRRAGGPPGDVGARRGPEDAQRGKCGCRRIRRRPCRRSSGSSRIATPGASAVSRGITPRQAGTVRTTRWLSSMSTAAPATSSVVSSRPPEWISAAPCPAASRVGDQLGVDTVGTDRAHPDPACPQLAVQRAGERHDGSLGRGVDGEAGHGSMRGQRADVEDLPAGRHRRDRGAASPENPGEVDVDQRGHLSRALLGQRPVEAHTGVLTHTASGAHAVAWAATSRCEASSRTSWATAATAPIPAAARRASRASRSVTTTACPRRTSRSATARPIPRAAPVTTADPCPAAGMPRSLSLTSHRYRPVRRATAPVCGPPRHVEQVFESAGGSVYRRGRRSGHDTSRR